MTVVLTPPRALSSPAEAFGGLQCDMAELCVKLFSIEYSTAAAGHDLRSSALAGDGLQTCLNIVCIKVNR